MSFGSTFTITVNAVAKVLTRIGDEGMTSQYRLLETTGMWKMFVRHSERTDPVTKELYYRHNIEVQHIVYATGGLPVRTRKYYAVADVPAADPLADLGYELTAFGDIVDTSGVQTDLLNLVS